MFWSNCPFHSKHSETKGHFELLNSNTAVSCLVSCSRALQQDGLDLCFLVWRTVSPLTVYCAVTMPTFDKACCAGASLFLEMCVMKSGD